MGLNLYKCISLYKFRETIHKYPITTTQETILYSLTLSTPPNRNIKNYIYINTRRYCKHNPKNLEIVFPNQNKTGFVSERFKENGD